MTTKDDGVMRGFDTGATRDTSEGKLDYDGFLSPTVLKQFAKYMNMNRLQSNGELRASDNWQKGIPMDVYRSSANRHWMEFWTEARLNPGIQNRLDLIGPACGLLFNIMGYMHEWLKTHSMVDFDGSEPTVEMRLRQEKIAEDKMPTTVFDGRGAKIMTFTGMPDQIDDDDVEDTRTPCQCGCGREDGECDGMSSVNDDEEKFCAICRFYNVSVSEHPCDCCDEDCCNFSH